QPRASDEERAEVLERCRAQILAAGLGERVMWVDLRRLAPVERALLVERQLVSSQLAAGKGGGKGAGEGRPRAVAIALPEERVSIMVNEEDHLRMQSIHSGLALGAALGEVDGVDDALE